MIVRRHIFQHKIEDKIFIGKLNRMQIKSELSAAHLSQQRELN
jgi:hypothetical protein